MQQPVPDGPPVAARIVITLLADGRMGTQCAGGNLLLTLGMLEKAKADLLAQAGKPAPGPKVEVAPPGLAAALGLH